MTTPNMGLTKPGVLTTPGPDYATEQNSDLDLLDSHDHSSGKGATVPHGGTSSGTTVAGDFSYSGFGPINQAYSRFAPGATPADAANGVYADNSGNLYYQNSGGDNVQLTSGSVIAFAGTTTDNGFWGFGGSGYALHAKAGFDGSKGQYRFSGTHADFDGTGSNAADVGAGRLYLAGLLQDYPVRIGTSWDQTNAWPTGGFAFHVTAADGTLMVGADPGATGDYSTTTAMRLARHGSAGVYTYALGINNGLNNVNDPSDALQINAVLGAGEAVPRTAARFGRNISGGVVAAGFGTRVRLEAPAAAASGYTQVTQAAWGSTWGASVGTDGGFTLAGASAGTITPTPGFQLMNTGGVDRIGIGGVPLTAGDNIFTVYGNILPNANNSWSVGLSGQEWSSFWTQNLQTSGATLTLVAGTSIAMSTATVAASAAITAGTTITATGAVSGSKIVPTSTASAPTASVGGLFKNAQVWAFGNVDAAGTVTQSYNVAGAATWSPTGTCVLNMTNAPSSAVVIAVPNTSVAVANLPIIQSSVAGGAITIYAKKAADGTSANYAFNFVVFGAP